MRLNCAPFVKVTFVRSQAVKLQILSSGTVKGFEKAREVKLRVSQSLWDCRYASKSRDILACGVPFFNPLQFLKKRYFVGTPVISSSGNLTPLYDLAI